MTVAGANDTLVPGGKVLVIGLDGGTWSVLDRFMSLGCMPTLKSLCESGYRADLMSTDPPLTPVAWSSFATGMNPGKHGVFGFLDQRAEPGSYMPPPVSSRSLRAPTLWRRVSDAGLRATVLSVPLTYPPEPINGFMVTGMFTPESAGNSTHPQSLAQELRRSGIMPKFSLDFTRRLDRGFRDAVVADALSGGAAGYFSDLNDVTERLRAASLCLMERPWDLFVSVFISTDRLQHVMWDGVESAEPNSERGSDIAGVYSRLDSAIADMVNAAGDDTTTLIVSDHGFGPCAGNFHMARWLVEAGYSAHGPRRAYGAAKNALGALGIKHVAGRVVRGLGVGRAVRKNFIPLDWSRTRAYFQPGTYGVRVNLRGREPEGVVEPGAEFEALRKELTERMTGMRDPSSGRRVVDIALRAEDLYDGEQLRFAPDIVLRPDPEHGYHLVPGDPGADSLTSLDPKTRGSHRPTGIFLARGPGVERGNAGRVDMTDVAPTIMRLLGLAGHDDLDGRVVKGIVADTLGGSGGAEAAAQFAGRDAAASDKAISETSEADTSTASEAEPAVPDEGSDYSEAERDEIRRRLRNLGYVD